MFKAHRLVYHLTLGVRVIKQKKKSNVLLKRSGVFLRSVTPLVPRQTARGPLTTTYPCFEKDALPCRVVGGPLAVWRGTGASTMLLKCSGVFLRSVTPWSSFVLLAVKITTQILQYYW